MEAMGGVSASFLETPLPGAFFTLLQAPSFQPVGELNNLFGLPYGQLALIYTPDTQGTWRENSWCVRLLQQKLLKEGPEHGPGAQGGAERGCGEG